VTPGKYVQQGLGSPTDDATPEELYLDPMNRKLSAIISADPQFCFLDGRRQLVVADRCARRPCAAGRGT